MTDYVKVFPNRSDPRLGRIVRHDSRSWNYPFHAADVSTLTSVRHHSNIPTLDQGSLGSCTGNAATKCLSYEPFWSESVVQGIIGADAVTDEKYAVGVYSEATKIDGYPGEYPPTDTGSDGLSVAKVLKSRGLIGGYRHAFSLEALLTALAQQPVIVGTEWRQDMFHPAADGKQAITGSVAGGHEYVLDEIDVSKQRVWMQNSWGQSWGLQGRAYFTWDDMRKLLAASGDCTVFAPLTAPPPPPPPPDPEAEFVAAAKTWLSFRHSSKVNVAFEKDVRKYLDSLG
ncbi:MAG: hypothetical protein QM655_08845 [Nocardioidaceae bacterium]